MKPNLADPAYAHQLALQQLASGQVQRVNPPDALQEIPAPRNPATSQAAIEAAAQSALDARSNPPGEEDFVDEPRSAIMKANGLYDAPSMYVPPWIHALLQANPGSAIGRDVPTPDYSAPKKRPGAAR